jgi:CRISPR-associated endoribonuclease Cas6
MPQSLVLNLVPASKIPQKYLSSQYLYELFLKLVSLVDAELGQILRTDHQNKSYTLSPLQVSNQTKSQGAIQNLRFLLPLSALNSSPLQYYHIEDVPAGTHCWWRISFLDDVLFGHLSREWEKQAHDIHCYLGPSKLHLINLVRYSQKYPDWASISTYQQIYEQASEHNREIYFQFLTPALFRQGAWDSPLPTREAIFQGLRKRWNRYSGLAFAPSIVNPIVPSQFDLNTVTFQDAQFKTIGCLGQLKFNILGEVDPLTLKRINTLADFTLYAGIGRKTNLGLGMVKRLKNQTPT